MIINKDIFIQSMFEMKEFEEPINRVPQNQPDNLNGDKLLNKGHKKPSVDFMHIDQKPMNLSQSYEQLENDPNICESKEVPLKSSHNFMEKINYQPKNVKFANGHQNQDHDMHDIPQENFDFGDVNMEEQKKLMEDIHKRKVNHRSEHIDPMPMVIKGSQMSNVSALSQGENTQQSNYLTILNQNPESFMKVNIKNFGYDSKNFPPIQRDPGRKRSRKPKNDNKFTTGRSKNAGPLLAVSGKSAKMNLKASDKAKGYTDLYDIIEEELQDTLHQSKGKKKKDEESIKFLQVHDSE